MIGDSAFGVGATQSATRILTFIAEACPIERTVRVHDALGPTSLVRVAEELRKTCASSSQISYSALSVGSAWAGLAWVKVFDGNRV